MGSNGLFAVFCVVTEGEGVSVEKRAQGSSRCVSLARSLPFLGSEAHESCFVQTQDVKDARCTNPGGDVNYSWPFDG